MFHHPHNCCAPGQAPLPCTLYVNEYPSGGPYGPSYTCPRLSWTCACEEGTLSMQTKVGGEWIDVYPWTPDGNTWVPTRLEILMSTGFRLKCTRETGVSYSNTVVAGNKESNCIKGTGETGNFTAALDVTYTHSTDGLVLDFEEDATLNVAHPSGLIYNRVWLNWYDGHAQEDGLPPYYDNSLDPDLRQLCFVITAEDGTEAYGLPGVPTYRRYWNFLLDTENCRVLCDDSSGVTDYVQRDWTAWPPSGVTDLGPGGVFLKFRVPSEAGTAWYVFHINSIAWGWGTVSGV